VILTGRAPRVGRDCRIRGYRSDTLEFTLLKNDEATAPSRDILPANFAGVWIGAAAQNNLCRASEWDTRGNGQKEYKYETRLTKVTDRSLEGWELECNVTFARRVQPYLQDQVAVEVEMSCNGESLSWLSKQLWNVQTIDNRKSLVVTTLKMSDLRDDSGKPVPNDFSGPTVSNYLECK
jgi:hypothetical protein